MDTIGDPDIHFDEKGVCNYCHTWERRAANFMVKGEEGRRQLKVLVDKIKMAGKGKSYDCIMGVSGGVDSTYVAWQAKQLGLRPLVVHFDNGWNSELSVKNIENIISKLGFDLYTYVIDWEEFRDLQLAYLKASVLDIEFPTDHAIVAMMYRLAHQHGIKYILSGFNIATEGILPTAWRWTKMDLLNLHSIHKAYGKVKLKSFPTMGFWKGIYYQYVYKIQFVQLLNYLDYDKKEAKELIARELGWKDYGGKHYESIFTRFYQGYILPRKFNIDKRKAHLSSLICSGQMTKEEALMEMKKDIYDPEQLAIDKEFVIKKFGLTDTEFEHIMNQPVRSHLDFGSYVTAHYKWHEMFFKTLRPVRFIYRLFRTTPAPAKY